MPGISWNHSELGSIEKGSEAVSVVSGKQCHVQRVTSAMEKKVFECLVFTISIVS